jgi:A/G-specific adenine glycosylase
MAQPSDKILQIPQSSYEAGEFRGTRGNSFEAADTSIVSESLRQQIREHLLAWSRAHCRHLPWRGEHDPYRIWVSEVMLQQTRVETVIPYYRRFLSRFPTLRSLAEADLDEVLKVWEGLGYYARARNLHRAARRVLEDHGGQLPAYRDALLALPGIGPYTVGAILSLAFRQDAAVLDGNVRRVLSRLFAVDGDLRSAATRKRLWNLAEALLPPGQAGPFNEGLMDLGATVCTARDPRCADCPLSEECQGYQEGNPGKYPARVQRRPLPHYDVAAGIIWRGEQVLISKRHADDLLGGLWELPGGKREDGETLEECLAREVREELGIEIAVGGLLITVRHAYTHFRVTIHVFHCRYLSGQPQALGCADWRWVQPDELGDFAFPAADRRILAALRRNGRRKEEKIAR